MHVCVCVMPLHAKRSKKEGADVRPGQSYFRSTLVPALGPTQTQRLLSFRRALGRCTFSFTPSQTAMPAAPRDIAGPESRPVP